MRKFRNKKYDDAIADSLTFIAETANVNGWSAGFGLAVSSDILETAIEIINYIQDEMDVEPLHVMCDESGVIHMEYDILALTEEFTVSLEICSKNMIDMTLTDHQNNINFYTNNIQTKSAMSFLRRIIHG